MTKSLSVRIKARTAIIVDTIKLVELDAAGLNLESTNGEIESVDSNMQDISRQYLKIKADYRELSARFKQGRDFIYDEGDIPITEAMSNGWDESEGALNGNHESFKNKIRKALSDLSKSKGKAALEEEKQRAKELETVRVQAAQAAGGDTGRRGDGPGPGGAGGVVEKKFKGSVEYKPEKLSLESSLEKCTYWREQAETYYSQSLNTDSMSSADQQRLFKTLIGPYLCAKVEDYVLETPNARWG